MKLLIIILLINIKAFSVNHEEKNFSLNYKKIDLTSMSTYHTYLQNDYHVTELSIRSKGNKNIPDWEKCSVVINTNFDKIPLYTTNRKQKGGNYLDDCRTNKNITTFMVLEKLGEFYCIFRTEKGKFWLHEENIISIIKSSGKWTAEEILIFNQIKMKINVLIKEQPIVSLDLSNILQAYHLATFLEFESKEYYKNNCGIHCLMASVAMIWPEKLQHIIDNPHIVDDLINNSVDDNMTQLRNSINVISCGSILALGSLIPNSTEMPNIMVPLASGLALNGIRPIGNTDKFLRNKIGMLPKKLQKLGNYCLETLELNENSNQMVLTEQVNFDEVLKDWHNILDNGSPIIVLIRATAFSGHFILIHSILDKDVYFWDQENFIMMSKEKLQELMDCHRTISLKTTSLLIGLNKPFNYLYFLKE